VRGIIRPPNLALHSRYGSGCMRSIRVQVDATAPSRPGINEKVRVSGASAGRAVPIDWPGHHDPVSPYYNIGRSSGRLAPVLV
jgi:hypothetical protein